MEYYLAECPHPEGTEDDNSGHYIFIPKISDGQRSHLYSEFKSIEAHQGDLASEIAIVYQDAKKEAVYQTLIRLGEGKEPIEFEVKMLAVPIGDKEGKEVIAKWRFDGIDSEDVFYTDSNGLEMQERKRDARPDWTMTSNMTVSNNYYPVTSAIAIRDKTSGAQVTVMNERAQGGTSLASGTIELMQHRRLLCMDSLNINEALNETQADGRGIAVNTRYFVSFSNANITSV